MEVDKGLLHWQSLEVIPKEFHTGILVLMLHGSHAYGTSTPDSDFDIRGVCIPPKKYYTGYLHQFEHLERKEPNDLTVYELQKFCKLAADGNPNILELLYIPESKWLYPYVSKTWKKLVENRHLFLSKKCKFTFSGYAISQLKRLKNHYLWLNTEEPKKPTREEFGLPEGMKLSVSEEQTLYKILGSAILPTQHQDILLSYVVKEKEYRDAHNEWDAYITWKTNRNPKRAELERKYGFDGKHALHLIRLMRMCQEILTTGEVLVERPDAEELLEIKNGKWTYEELINWAEGMDVLMDVLYQTSTLQKEPNRSAIDELCQELIEEHLFYNKE